MRRFGFLPKKDPGMSGARSLPNVTGVLPSDCPSADGSCLGSTGTDPQSNSSCASADSCSSMEGTMQLTVVLPDGRRIPVEVDCSTSMLDVLVRVASENEFSPAGLVLRIPVTADQPPSTAVQYKPSTPIGTISGDIVYVVPKSDFDDTSSRANRAKLNKGGTNGQLPFERTQRIQIALTPSRRTLVRVSVDLLIGELLSRVLADHASVVDGASGDFELRRADLPSVPIDTHLTIRETGVTHFVLVRSSTSLNDATVTDGRGQHTWRRSSENLPKSMSETAVKEKQKPKAKSSLLCFWRGCNVKRKRTTPPTPEVPPVVGDTLLTGVSNTSDSSGTAPAVVVDAAVEAPVDISVDRQTPVTSQPLPRPTDKVQAPREPSSPPPKPERKTKRAAPLAPPPADKDEQPPPTTTVVAVTDAQPQPSPSVTVVEHHKDEQQPPPTTVVAVTEPQPQPPPKPPPSVTVVEHRSQCSFSDESSSGFVDGGGGGSTSAQSSSLNSAGHSPGNVSTTTTDGGVATTVSSSAKESVKKVRAPSPPDKESATGGETVAKTPKEEVSVLVRSATPTEINDDEEVDCNSSSDLDAGSLEDDQSDSDKDTPRKEVTQGVTTTSAAGRAPPLSRDGIWHSEDRAADMIRRPSGESFEMNSPPLMLDALHRLSISSDEGGFDAAFTHHSTAAPTTAKAPTAERPPLLSVKRVPFQGSLSIDDDDMVIDQVHDYTHFRQSPKPETLFEEPEEDESTVVAESSRSDTPTSAKAAAAARTVSSEKHIVMSPTGEGKVAYGNTNVAMVHRRQSPTGDIISNVNVVDVRETPIRMTVTSFEDEYIQQTDGEDFMTRIRKGVESKLNDHLGNEPTAGAGERRRSSAVGRAMTIKAEYTRLKELFDAWQEAVKHSDLARMKGQPMSAADGEVFARLQHDLIAQHKTVQQLCSQETPAQTAVAPTVDRTQSNKIASAASLDYTESSLDDDGGNECDDDDSEEEHKPTEAAAVPMSVQLLRSISQSQALREVRNTNKPETADKCFGISEVIHEEHKNVPNLADLKVEKMEREKTNASANVSRRLSTMVQSIAENVSKQHKTIPMATEAVKQPIVHQPRHSSMTALMEKDPISKTPIGKLPFQKMFERQIDVLNKQNAAGAVVNGDEKNTTTTMSPVQNGDTPLQSNNGTDVGSANKLLFDGDRRPTPVVAQVELDRRHASEAHHPPTSSSLATTNSGNPFGVQLRRVSDDKRQSAPLRVASPKLPGRASFVNEDDARAPPLPSSAPPLKKRMDAAFDVADHRHTNSPCPPPPPLDAPAALPKMTTMDAKTVYALSPDELVEQTRKVKLKPVTADKPTVHPKPSASNSNSGDTRADLMAAIRDFGKNKLKKAVG